jgi:hypothetical protein
MRFQFQGGLTTEQLREKFDAAKTINDLRLLIDETLGTSNRAENEGQVDEVDFVDVDEPEETAAVMRAPESTTINACAQPSTFAAGESHTNELIDSGADSIAQDVCAS